MGNGHIQNIETFIARIQNGGIFIILKKKAKKKVQFSPPETLSNEREKRKGKKRWVNFIDFYAFLCVCAFFFFFFYTALPPGHYN